MEEPFLAFDESEWSAGSGNNPSQTYHFQDIPMHEALEQEIDMLKLEIEGLRVQLAQQAAQMVEGDDRDITESRKDDGVSWGPY